MQLDQLEFVVKTEQLDTAITKIRKLGEEVSKLPKGGLGGLPIGGGGTRGAGRDVEDFEKKLEKLREQLKFLRNDQELSNLGFTKMQAGMLAAIKVAGAGEKTIASFATEFDKLNKITGQNPFDKSSQGLKKLENDLREIEEVTKYTAQGFKLTSDQVKALSRDLEAMRQRNEALNVSDQEISRLQKEHISLFAQKADQLNKYNAEAARSTAAAKTLANADAKLLEQEQKLAFTNKQLADGLSQGSANALYNYKKQIDSLGLSTEQAAKRVASFREQLVIKQGYSPLAKLSKDTEETSKRLDHLSRALGPQITDIFVGLATGQSLLTVALQQGGQIRDQVALAGVASSDMGKALSTAAVQMVGSLKDVAVAMGSLLITPFIAGGKAITEFGLAAIGATEKYKLLRVQMAMSEDAGSKLATTTYRLLSVIPALVGSMLGAIAVAVIAVTAAMIKNQSQMDNLTRSLVLTGASMDITSSQALILAESMNEAGIGTSKALDVMTSMAKQGGFVASEIEMVTKSAVDLQKYGGVAIEDTVKSFAKMREKPVEALIEIGKSTGFVSLETIKLVKSLEDQGKYADATAIAMKAKADADEEAIKRLKSELTPLVLLWIDIKELIDQATTAIYNFANSSSSVAGFRTVFETVSVIIAEVWYTISQVGNEIGGIAAQITAIVGGLSRGDVFGGFREASSIHDMMQKDAAAARQSQDELVASIMNRNKVQVEGITISNSEAAANSKAVSEYLRATKQREEAARKAKKDSEDLRKEREKDIESYNDLMNVYTGYTKTYNNQVESLKRLLSSKEISPEKFTEAMFALEQLQPYFKKSEDAFISYNEEIEKHTKVVKDLQDTNSAEVSSLEHRASLLGKTADEQRLLTIEYEKQQKLLKLDIQYNKELAALEARGFDGEYGENKRKELEKQFSEARILIAKDANLKIAEDYQKQFEAIQKELGDVMFLALTNRGAQAGKKLRDLIKAELMKPITVVINAAVNAIFGDAINSLLDMVGVKVPGAASAAGSLGSAAGLYKTGSDIYSATTGGFAKAGTAASALTERFATSALGQKLGLSSVQSVNVPVYEGSTANMVSNGTANQTVMTESGQSLTSGIGNLAASITATLVGQALRKAIAGGYKMSTGLENVANIAGIVAGFDKTGFSQIVVGVVSGLASRAFGTKLTQSGIQGTFGGEQGFTGSRYTFEKGGWFRSDKERMQPLEQELQSGLALAFNVTKFEVQKFTDYMGVGADAIANFSYKMKLNLKGLSEADALKALDAEFGKVKELMAAAVLAGKSYGKANESSYQTLERLATTVYSVNSIFKDLGANVLAAGYAGVDTALMFSEFFGGVDKFGSSLSKFYESFYTDAERTTNLTINTTDAFKALGLALPTSRDAFKELVKSAINAGNPQLLTSLLGLQDSFLALTEPVEDLSNAFTQLTDNLLEEVKRLRGAIVSDASLSGGIPGLTAEFAILTAQAKSGNTTALEKLPEYSQAIEQAVAASAVNASDVAYARAWLAESLGNTNAVLNGTSTSIVSTSLTQDVAGTTTVNGATALTASNSSQADLIAALVAEVQGLRAEVRADVAANSKTAKILERANQDGETLSVTVAA
jgi:hypothetical protein